MNPSLGRNFEAMDPLERLARLSDHIPDPGQHRIAGRLSRRPRAPVRPREAPPPDKSASEADTIHAVSAIFRE
jgi:hypothetical protein